MGFSTFDLQNSHLSFCTQVCLLGPRTEPVKDSGALSELTEKVGLQLEWFGVEVRRIEHCRDAHEGAPSLYRVLTPLALH